MIGDLLLVITIDGRKAALRAADVASVIEIETLVPIPFAPLPIAGLATLRSRVLTVIDARAALGLTPDGADPRGRHAVVIDSAGHGYALLVDQVLDVTSALSDLAPTRTDQGGAWAASSRGTVETADEPLLLLDGDLLVQGGRPARAA